MPLSQAPRRTRKIYVFAVSFACGFALGTGAVGGAYRQSRIYLGQAAPNIAGIAGVLLDDPRTTSRGSGAATIALRETAGKSGVRTSARGNVLVFFPEGSIPRLKEFGRKSEVFVDGTFNENSGGAMNGDFTFRAKGVHINKSAPPVEQLRTKARLAVIDAFSREAAGGSRSNAFGGLALALLLGIKDNLDSHLAKQYRDAGCSYILALSGMHLAIISALIAFLLKKPLGKKGAAAVGAVFIILYVFIVGAAPSLMRAAIMYLFGTAAILGGFAVRPSLVLQAAFLLQIVFDPASGSSISFLLSYLALAGILSIGEAAGALMRGLLPPKIASPLSAGIGAFLATQAITVWFFGSLRLIGIIAGLIMVPLTTVFMIGSIAYLALSFVFPPLTPLLSVPLNIIYKALEITAGGAAKFPALNTPPNVPVMLFSVMLPFAFLAAHHCIIKKKYGIMEIS
ncbi:hypothetical protein FACS1894190_16570 [Spirochaetia bacterium]|nr:hypothetical protein FACS1894190_16570 [Spirochaetia bacterium]